MAVWERARRALDDAGRKWPQAQILTIAHQGIIKALVYRIWQIRFGRTEPESIHSPAMHLLSRDTLGRLVYAGRIALPAT